MCSGNKHYSIADIDTTLNKLTLASNSSITVLNGESTYSINEVVSEFDNRSGNDYNYGVSGFVGKCRCNSLGVTIQNVVFTDGFYIL